MKKFTIVMASLIVVVLAAGVAMANWQSELLKGGIYSPGPGGEVVVVGSLTVPELTIGSNKIIGMGLATIDNATSTTTVTLTGVLAGDKVFATMNTNSTTYKSLQAIPGSGIVVLKTEANVGTTSTVSLLVVR